jgi:hypothetical protein
MGVAIALLIISMTAPVASSSADFSIFNSGWNGTSDLAVLTYQTGKFAPAFQVHTTGTDVTVEQSDLATLDLDPVTDALVIIGPTKTFSSAEGEHIREFVRLGGKLLLADDFGTGNSLLEGMNATSRFTGNLVVDLAYEKQPEFSVLFDFQPGPLTKNVSTLLLNYPSCLAINASRAAVFASSSIASWQDTNGNRLQEWGEPRGPFPIVASEPMGFGSILLISDPSLLINGMRDKMDDAVFGNNVIEYICGARTKVYFDESHRTFLDPVAITLKFTGKVSANTRVAIAAVALFLTIWISTDLVDKAFAWSKRKILRGVSFIIGILPFKFLKDRPPEKPKPIGTEELLAKIAEEHPDWRTGLVRYIIRERERQAEVLKPK